MEDTGFYHIRCIDPDKSTWLGYILCFGTIDNWDKVTEEVWDTITSCQIYTQEKYGIKARYIS